MSDPLVGVLERSRELGFLGPGPVSDQIDHARAFVSAWEGLSSTPPARLCDLGSGGGIPGLVLAGAWPSANVVLLDAGARRCDFLREAVQELGWAQRCEVAEGRAELLARTPALEGSFDLVVARSFGPPAVVVECASRFLRDGGLLLVAEPPSESATGSRWPAGALAKVGFGPAEAVTGPPRLVRLSREGPLDERLPRRDGVPAKRPLF